MALPLVMLLKSRCPAIIVQAALCLPVNKPDPQHKHVYPTFPQLREDQSYCEFKQELRGYKRTLIWEGSEANVPNQVMHFVINVSDFGEGQSRIYFFK
jgi:hypothetical protein